MYRYQNFPDSETDTKQNYRFPIVLVDSFTFCHTPVLLLLVLAVGNTSKTTLTIYNHVTFIVSIRGGKYDR